MGATITDQASGEGKTWECASLPVFVVLGMGDDSVPRIRSSLEPIVKRDGDFWWLRVLRCGVCGQWWLDAQEGRINDVWVMRKLPNDEADAVLFGAGAWPSDLDRYVTLLRAGLNAGHKVKWIEPLDERTRQMLRETLSGIRDEEPDISLEEAAALLSMTTDQVGLLLKGG